MRNLPLTAYLDSSSNPVILVGMDGRIAYANPAACELFGYQEEGLEGAEIEVLVPPRIRDQHRSLRDAYMQAPVPRPMARSMDLSAWTRAGEEIPVEISLSPVPLPEGMLVSVTITDTRERRRLTEQLLHAQKMEAVGRLASGVAHDFNSLLTLILSYSDFVRDDLPEESILREDVSEIRRAGLRASALTRRLLALSRRDSREARLVDLNHQITEMEKLLGRVLSGRIRMRLDLAEDLPWLMLDPAEIEQVVLNLALNARDAMPSGGDLAFVTRFLPDGQGEVGEIELRVSDTGVGIDDAVRERIFEPFFTTKGEGHGTGLGLSIVHDVVRDRGGSIELTETPGGGTTFVLRFPVTRRRPEEEALGPGETELGGSETILLVDDDLQVRRVTQRILEALGYRVLVAGDRIEAEAVAEKEPEIDLLISDLFLPQTSGFAVGSRLRERRPGLKVLFVSGYAFSPEVAAAHGLSEAPFLPKPFDPGRLGRKVREVLGGRPGAPVRSTPPGQPETFSPA